MKTRYLTVIETDDSPATIEVKSEDGSAISAPHVRFALTDHEILTGTVFYDLVYRPIMAAFAAARKRAA